MEDRIETLIRWMNGETPPPVKFDVFVTTRCNLSCCFCEYPRISRERKNELSHSELLKLTNDACKMGAGIFGILGGEPFVRQETTIKIMETVKSNGRAGSIVTNGTLLDEENLRKVIKMKWDLIRFSIDGATAEIHDKLRGISGTFEKAIRCVARIQKLKQELNSDYPTVELNTVVCRENFRQIPEIIRLAGSLGVKWVYFLPMIVFSERAGKIAINEGDIPEVIERLNVAKRLGKELNVNSNLEQIEKDHRFAKSNDLLKFMQHENKGFESEDSRWIKIKSREGMEARKKRVKEKWTDIACYMPWYSISIDSGGWVTPCGQIETDERINVRNFDSLESMWKGEYFKRLRENMLKGIMPKGCNRCCMPLFEENAEIRARLNELNNKLIQVQNEN